MEKLTEPINIYFEGSQEKAGFYSDSLKALGYEVSFIHDYRDDRRLFYNYPDTFKILDCSIDSVMAKVVKDNASHLDTLIPKFKPFDKVIGKGVGEKWTADIYSHFDHSLKSHICIGNGYPHVLPYEGNEGKVGKTDDEWLESLPF